MKYEQIMEQINKELHRASIKHPRWPTDKLRQAVVVAEEANETLKAMLTLIETEESVPPEVDPKVFWSDRLRVREQQILDEAVQTVAMGIKFLMNYERKYG